MEKKKVFDFKKKDNDKGFDNEPKTFQRVYLAKNGSFVVEQGTRIFLHPNFLGAIQDNAKDGEGGE